MPAGGIPSEILLKIEKKEEASNHNNPAPSSSKFPPSHFPIHTFAAASSPVFVLQFAVANVITCATIYIWGKQLQGMIARWCQM